MPGGLYLPQYLGEIEEGATGSREDFDWLPNLQKVRQSGQHDVGRQVHSS